MHSKFILFINYLYSYAIVADLLCIQIYNLYMLSGGLNWLQMLD